MGYRRIFSALMQTGWITSNLHEKYGTDKFRAYFASLLEEFSFLIKGEI